MPLALSKQEFQLKPKYTVYHYNQQFSLECGSTLPELKIAYTTFGTLAPDKSNVIWVFHALTANSDPVEWWPGLVGEGCVINPEEHFIICANILGSCYGTTGPDDIDSRTNQKFGFDFPLITIRDMVGAHELLRIHLKIDTIHLGIGGSMGGHQLLEWSVSSPDLFANICLVATSARHSAWGIAFNAAQRMAMEADSSLGQNGAGAGHAGLEAARAIALLSYRSQLIYNAQQTDECPILEDYKAEQYQRYQGEKLSKRFTPLSYWYLSKAMDSHNIGRNRGNANEALKGVKARTLAIGIRSDLLFPTQDQDFIASYIPNGELVLFDSDYGHDGFLVEVEVIGGILKDFLNKSYAISQTVM